MATMTEDGQFEVKDVKELEGTATIGLTGDLDYSIYTAFKRAIKDLVAQGINNITYDLTALSYIQSLGLGIIMWSYVELETRGGAVSINGANDKIKAVFTAAQLDTLVELK